MTLLRFPLPPAAVASAVRPVMLHDCTRHGPESGAELFVVEGDCACAAVVAVRDPERQAVLPLQGKPLNALRARPARVQADRFLGLLADAIGTGHGPGATLHGLRYERVLLLLDPDADGIHIGALLLMYFERWMPALLDAGRIERVHAPVGEVHGPAGTAPVPAFGEAHFRALCEQARARQDGLVVARRHRGLGGIAPATLRAGCIEPSTRLTSVLDAEGARHAARVFGVPVAARHRPAASA
jgi:DNA gyrase subunit B